MFEELKTMNAELEALKKAHLEKSKTVFTDVTKKLFDAHPTLKSFGWKQYTPYFNDGDECVFSAQKYEPDINGINGYDVNFEHEFVTDYRSKDPITGAYPQIKNEDYNHELGLAVKDVKEFLDNVDDSVLRDLFGDHVKIKVTREGTEVEDYDHD